MKNKRRRSIILFGIIMLASIGATIISANNIMQKKGGEQKVYHFNSNNDYDNRIETKKNDIKNAELKEKAKKIYEKNKDLLVLVNRTEKMPGTYAYNLTYICDGRLEADERIVHNLEKMFAAAGEQGHHYLIASAYRSRERQEFLVEKNVENLMAQGMTKKKALTETYRQQQKPGHSEHETGLALDILCTENTIMENEAQANLPANKWLRKHCYEYGFVLRYPKNKEDITEIAYESWHFRYVGKEAAKFMKENDLTLEEFYECL